MDIKITTNAVEVSKWLLALEREQIPFVTSKAVNETAKGLKRTEQKKIPKYFDMRTNWLMKSGALPLVLSNKRQFPNIEASMSVVDNVAALAAIGGIKKAGGRSMAVPMSDTGNGQSTRESLNPTKKTLTPATWPSRIVKKTERKKVKRRKNPLKPKPFMLQSSRTGQHYIAIREGKEASPLKILYGFEDTVQIPKLWPLVENSKRYVDRNFERHFAVEFQKAIKD